MFQIHSRNKKASASWAGASRLEHAGAQTLGLLTFPPGVGSRQGTELAKGDLACRRRRTG